MCSFRFAFIVHSYVAPTLNKSIIVIIIIIIIIIIVIIIIVY